jgi:hypothetical protein
MEGKGLRCKTNLYYKCSGSGWQELIILSEEKFCIKLSYVDGNKSQTRTKEYKEISWLDQNNNNIFKALIVQLL